MSPRLGRIAALRQSLSMPVPAPNRLTASAMAQPGNAPVAVYKQCQQHASVLALRAPASKNELFDEPVQSAFRQTIDDVRNVRKDTEATKLSAWPEDTPVGRGLAESGVKHTPDHPQRLRGGRKRTGVKECADSWPQLHGHCRLRPRRKHWAEACAEHGGAVRRAAIPVPFNSFGD